MSLAVQMVQVSEKCMSCEKHVRKIQVLEQTLSGRDAVIEALQNQLQKFELNYKKLLGEFEKLRYEHSCALQDNANLTELNSKLEEIARKPGKKSLFTISEKASQTKPPDFPDHIDNLFSVKQIQNAAPLKQDQSSVLPFIKEIKVQNRILTDLVEKFFSELKVNQSSKYNLMESKDLNDCKHICGICGAENEPSYSITTDTKEPNDCRTTCRACGAVPATHEFEELEQSATHGDEELEQNAIVKLRFELKRKEETFKECTCKLMVEINSVHQNNEILAETLEIITAENKNNLSIIQKMKEELNRSNKDYENKCLSLMNRIKQLENELDDSKVTERNFRRASDVAENEIQTLKDTLEHLIEEKNNIKEKCSCKLAKDIKDFERLQLLENNQEFKSIEQLQLEMDGLKKELMEKTLEMTELEEENRHFCQNLESVTKYSQDLNRKINELSDELEYKNQLLENWKEAREINKQELSTHIFDDEVEELRQKVRQLTEENRVLAAELRNIELEEEKRVQDLDRNYRISITSNIEELAKLGKENENLIAEIERLKKEHKAEAIRLQDLVDYSQKQFEMVLNERDAEKRKSLEIEEEKKVQDLERNKSIASNIEELVKLGKENDELKAEIERLKEENKAEILRLQEVVNDSQKQVEMLQDLERTNRKSASSNIEENVKLGKENDELKAEIERLKKENEAETLRLQDLVNHSEKQVEMLQDLERTNRKSIASNIEEHAKLSKENDELRAEIERLKKENKAETLRLQDLVNHSQKQVEMLLNEHDEKTSQIENVANELDIIRKSVTEDNENFLNKIRNLEKERDSLKEKLEDHMSECISDEAKIEIERLKEELIIKQSIIADLEKSVDNFSDTLKKCNKTAEELGCENLCLKNMKTKFDDQFQTLQNKTTEQQSELIRISRALESAKEIAEKTNKSNALLEAELNELRDQCQQACQKKRESEVENASLKNELGQLRNSKSKLEKTLMENYELQMEVERANDSFKKRERTASMMTEELQQAYDELKSQFDRKLVEVETLKNDLRLSTKQKEGSKKANESLQAENDRLKRQVLIIQKEIDLLSEERDNLLQEQIGTSAELQGIRNSLDKEARVRRMSQQTNDELNDKFNKLQKEYDQKNEELKKIKKQYESYAKQSQITRDEYVNLRKEYKEIKSMLSEQIKRYKQNAGAIEPGQECDVTKFLRDKLLDKENQVRSLQQELTDASYEIVELKDAIHKVKNDNNVLKSAINSLITNLERKIKGPSLTSLPSNSAEIIAGEILSSLSTIEDTITKIGEESCPRNCRDKDCVFNQPSKMKKDSKSYICSEECTGLGCDCMHEITSQYTPIENSSNGASGIKSRASKLSKEVNVTNYMSLKSSYTGKETSEPKSVAIETSDETRQRNISKDIRSRSIDRGIKSRASKLSKEENVTNYTFLKSIYTSEKTKPFQATVGTKTSDETRQPSISDDLGPRSNERKITNYASLKSSYTGEKTKSSKASVGTKTSDEKRRHSFSEDIISPSIEREIQWSGLSIMKNSTTEPLGKQDTETNTTDSEDIVPYNDETPLEYFRKTIKELRGTVDSMMLGM